jgi:hypothetical protein
MKIELQQARVRGRDGVERLARPQSVAGRVQPRSVRTGRAVGRDRLRLGADHILPEISPEIRAAPGTRFHSWRK